MRIDLATEQYKDQHPVPLSSETSSSSGTYFPLSLEYLPSAKRFHLVNTFLYIFHRIIRKASGEIKAMTRNVEEGGGRRDEGSNVYNRAERWEGGRERRDEGEGTKYQRTILQSKQDGGCHGLSSSECNKLFRVVVQRFPPGVTPRSFSSKLQRAAPDRMHRCHRSFSPCSSSPLLLLLERGKQFRPAKGDHLASNFASERPAVLFNLEERKGGRYWESGRVVAGQDWNERERNRSIKFTQAYFKEIEGKRCGARKFLF